MCEGLVGRAGESYGQRRGRGEMGIGTASAVRGIVLSQDVAR